MSDNLSSNRLIRNEQIIRNRNTEAKKNVKNFLSNSRRSRATVIDFACECSAMDCEETIPLTILAYEKIHKRKNRFVLAPGHEIETIESVVVGLNDYNVVEKEALSP